MRKKLLSAIFTFVRFTLNPNIGKALLGNGNGIGNGYVAGLGFWGSCSWVAVAFHQHKNTITLSITLCSRLFHLLIKILPSCLSGAGHKKCRYLWHRKLRLPHLANSTTLLTLLSSSRQTFCICIWICISICCMPPRFVRATCCEFFYFRLQHAFNLHLLVIRKQTQQQK